MYALHHCVGPTCRVCKKKAVIADAAQAVTEERVADVEHEVEQADCQWPRLGGGGEGVYRYCVGFTDTQQVRQSYRVCFLLLA